MGGEWCERQIEIGGRQLVIYSAGSDGPSVVLIAGGGAPAAFAAPLQDRISRLCRVLSYDRAGLGESPPPRPLTFEEHAHDLRNLLAAAEEPGPFILVGESFGGLVARAFAQQVPELVAGMILVDSAEEVHVFKRLDVLLRSGRQQFAVVRLLRPLGLRGLLMSRSAPPAFDREQRRRISAIVRRRQHWMAAMAEAEAYAATPPERRVVAGFGALGDLPLTVIAHGRPSVDRTRPWRKAGWTHSSGWPASPGDHASWSPSAVVTELRKKTPISSRAKFF